MCADAGQGFAALCHRRCHFNWELICDPQFYWSIIMIQIKGFLSLFSYKSLSKLFVYVWYVHGCEPAYMQVHAGVCVGTRGLHQMSFSITLHFPLGDRDGTIALVEPGAFHFRQMGQPGSFWDPPSPPVLSSVSTGSLALAVRFFFFTR